MGTPMSGNPWKPPFVLRISLGYIVVNMIYPASFFLRDSAAKILWQAMELITIQKKNCSRKVTIYTSICHGADCHTYIHIYIYVYTDWWFGTFFIVPNSWDDDPI